MFFALFNILFILEHFIQALSSEPWIRWAPASVWSRRRSVPQQTIFSDSFDARIVTAPSCSIGCTKTGRRWGDDYRHWWWKFCTSTFVFWHCKYVVGSNIIITCTCTSINVINITYFIFLIFFVIFIISSSLILPLWSSLSPSSSSSSSAPADLLSVNPDALKEVSNVVQRRESKRKSDKTTKKGAKKSKISNNENENVLPALEGESEI